MSCGQPHDTDCSEVIEAVYLYLDGELEHDGVDRIRQHLDECSPCLREYGIEREVKILVARSCCEAPCWRPCSGVCPRRESTARQGRPLEPVADR